MGKKDLEWVPGDPTHKELIQVDPGEHELWKSTWAPSSYVVHDFFNDDELTWLEDLMYKEHNTRRVKKNGTLHFNVDNRKIQDKFYEKLKSVIPELTNDTKWEGNFLITSTPYNLHIDTGNPITLKNSNSIPGKQFIIPLWVCHRDKITDGTDEHPLAGTAVFKNRFIMYGTNFAKDDSKYDTNVFWTVRDYNNLTCYRADGSVWENIDWNAQTVDNATYRKYFRHFPQRWLEGFELEAVHNWVRGDLIVFDRCQAHSGIDFPFYGVTIKCGLSMMATVKNDQ